MTPYTVGIPVRNEQNTLADCINSILHQTRKPDQILICVNGSTDNTYYIADEMSKNNKAISVITSNPGKPNAWNEIAERSKHNPIMMIDGDAVINSYAAEDLYSKLFKNKETLISSGKIAFTKPENETLFSKFFTEKYNEPININFLPGSLYMMKKKELISYAKSLEIDLMPTDVVSEDKLLEQITGMNNSRQQASRAYATRMPVGNFSDWIEETVRVQEGRKQLKEKYPKLQSRKKQIAEHKNRLDRWKELNMVKKIGLANRYALYCLIGFYVQSSKRKYDTLWKGTPSTKQSFEMHN